MLESVVTGMIAIALVGATLTPQEINGIVSAHNSIRSQYCLSPIQWDAELGSISQSYANLCLQRHNADATRAGFGENIYDVAGSGLFGVTPVRAVWNWADEERYWSCESGMSSGITGHFIQLVRNTTVKVGCGSASCVFPAYPSYTFLHVVCNYWTGSNPSVEPFPKRYCSGVCDSVVPTMIPTQIPSPTPTMIPTQIPSPIPTMIPTELPTQMPSPAPTQFPTLSLTFTPVPPVSHVYPTESPSPSPVTPPVVASLPDNVSVVTESIAVYMILCYLPLLIYAVYRTGCKPPSEIRNEV